MGFGGKFFEEKKNKIKSFKTDVAHATSPS
jgi:hypothetical protein